MEDINNKQNLGLGKDQHIIKATFILEKCFLVSNALAGIKSSCIMQDELYEVTTDLLSTALAAIISQKKNC